MLEAAWLIPALPLAGFITLVLVGRRLGEPIAGWLATGAMGGSFAATALVFVGLVDRPAEERFFLQRIFTWVPSGSFEVDLGFFVDPLSITMCLFITGIGTLIHLYSIGYMHGDENFSKFFLYLNLFAASMLVLVLGDNLLLTFLGWEGVGACSYFLISFWFTDEANASAGKKAFVTNRIGDFGYMLGMFLVFHALGTIRYADILTGAEGGLLSAGMATAIVLLFMLAAAGKSAQIPLFVWLPDAMAGPTPVSALIHAATMVTSGIYLLTRLNPVLAAADPWATDVVAWIGALTALVAALAAVVQTDIKKVLAYSTVSQLGYMFLAVGLGGFVPAIFHMVTHAFFKALLFLGSGSVIHGVHDEQDMRRMGGLAKIMPITAMTFIIGWLAIAGVPPFSGFWSKDEILLYAWNEPGLAGKALWAIGLVTAILTAFYMTRQVILTFFGRIRLFDATGEEIAAAFDQRVVDAEAEIAVADEAVASARTAFDKAQADVTKREEAVAKAAAGLDEARTAMAGSDPEADGHAKLVKALEKAEKAGPKADDALVKARGKLDDARDAITAAEGAVEDARSNVATVAGQKASAPSAPAFVTAFTEAPDVSAFEDQLPASYHERKEYHPHESPWTMTLPLVALAGLAAAGGMLNLPFTSDLHFLQHWLEPSLFGNEVHVTASGGTKIVLAAIAVAAGLVAIAAAFAVYLRGKVDPAAVEKPQLALAVHYDKALAVFMGGPGRKLFDGMAWFDRTFVDGAVNGVASGAQNVGRNLRVTQPGFVRQYALGIMFGVGVVGVWLVLRMFQ